MIAVSDTELYKAFPREFPQDLARTTEGDLSEFEDDRTEAEKLVGKRWEDIGADFLQGFFDLATWLNPRAFHYFFPAFIKQSQAEMKKTSLLVDSLIDMLGDKETGKWPPDKINDVEAKLLAEYPEMAVPLDAFNAKDWSAWRRDRWQLFTRQQWALIRKWLDWINKDKRWEVDRDLLRKAIKNAEDWQTKQVGSALQR